MHSRGALSVFLIEIQQPMTRHARVLLDFLHLTRHDFDSDSGTPLFLCMYLIDGARSSLPSGRPEPGSGCRTYGSHPQQLFPDLCAPCFDVWRERIAEQGGEE